MGRYFLDSSALIKRYLNDEPGHAWVAVLCAPQAGNDILIAEATIAEVVAAFCRMARMTPRRLRISQRDRLIVVFRQRDLPRGYVVQSVDRSIDERAGDLCVKHPLRAYDAIQLACALTASDDALRAQIVPPTFVCSDSDLLAAAAAEGVRTGNPANHP